LGEIISVQFKGISRFLVPSSLAKTTPYEFSAVERYIFLWSPKEIYKGKSLLKELKVGFVYNFCSYDITREEAFLHLYLISLEFSDISLSYLALQAILCRHFIYNFDPNICLLIIYLNYLCIHYHSILDA